MRWILLALLVYPTGPGMGGADPAVSDELRILFVGNSLTYSNRLPERLGTWLNARDGSPAVVESIARPGHGLQDHWPDRRTRKRIREGDWDLVILQQGPSATKGRASLFKFSKKFAETIRSAGARPALYMVWPARARSFDFDGVSESYAMAAEQVDGVLFPVGDAWRQAWVRDETLALYGSDGFHPSPLGSYLAALVIYQQLTGVTERDVPAPEGVDARVADLLFEAAVAANQAVPAARSASDRLVQESRR